MTPAKKPHIRQPMHIRANSLQTSQLQYYFLHFDILPDVSLFPHSKSDLLLLYPRQQTNERENSSHDDSPQLDMQSPLVKTSLRGRGDRCEAEYEQQVSTRAVIFVDGLCIVHTPIDTRGIILRDSHNSLNSVEDVCYESKDAVRGGEMGAGVGEFVVLDYYESGKKA